MQALGKSWAHEEKHGLATYIVNSYFLCHFWYFFLVFLYIGFITATRYILYAFLPLFLAESSNIVTKIGLGDTASLVGGPEQAPHNKGKIVMLPITIHANAPLYTPM